MNPEKPDRPGTDNPDLTIQAIGAVLRTMHTSGEVVAGDEEGMPATPRYEAISVFSGWGQGREPFHDEDDMTPEMRRFWQEIQMRGRVNKEIRETLAARGVRISESKENSGHGADQSEVVINPRIDYGWLNEALPSITSEVQPVPSEDIAAYMRHQTLPVLVYMEGLAGGEGKLVIDTPEQIHKVARLLEEQPWTKDYPLKFKPIIETPSDRYTSFRVLVTPAGDILGSGLLYSPERTEEYTNPADAREDPRFRSYKKSDYLTDPHSPYYLNGRNITSNITGGGGCIPLDPTERSRAITDNEREILAAHGMQDQRLLEPIHHAAQKIGKHLGGRGGLVYGLDFMLGTDGTIWFLEAGADPGVQTMNEVANGGRRDFEQGYRLLMQRAADSVFPT
jgi:hypothetical protein